MSRIGAWIPVALVLGLLVLLGVGLSLKPGEVPSPLIGKPAPGLNLPALRAAGDPQAAAALQQRPRLVNYFASWCTPCLVEHPLLMELSKRDDLVLLGVNYKDARQDAERWLSRHGDPYDLILADRDGAAGLDWGVYGVPETFVLSADGTVLYKQIGPLTEQDWISKVAPALGVQP